MIPIVRKIMELIPPDVWGWRIWRYVNPIHLVLAAPYSAVFSGCGFWSVQAQLGIIGITHELGDGDFDSHLVSTAPWEGIKDTYSFILGGLLYYGVRAII